MIHLGTSDNLVRIWSLETGKLLSVLKGHTGYVNHMDSHDGM